MSWLIPGGTPSYELLRLKKFNNENLSVEVRM